MSLAIAPRRSEVLVLFISDGSSNACRASGCLRHLGPGSIAEAPHRLALLGRDSPTEHSRLVTSRHVTSARVLSRHVTPRHVTCENQTVSDRAHGALSKDFEALDAEGSAAPLQLGLTKTGWLVSC